jgi:HD-like signal output (HDOD) protein
MAFPKTLQEVLLFMEGKHIDDCFFLMQRIREISEATKDGSQESVQRLVEIVKSAEGLSTRILKAAGVQTLRQDELHYAILKLGTTEVRDISLRHAYRSTSATTDRFRRDLWNFNFCHALVADHCRKLLTVEGEAYLPALLERLGVIVFHQYYGPEYRQLRESLNSSTNLYAHETATLGYNSIDVGAQTLHLWGLEALTAPLANQLTPATEIDKVRYFARSITSKITNLFPDGVTYDPAVIDPLAKALGSDFHVKAIEHLRSALLR